jgi:hypothetical protein
MARFPAASIAGPARDLPLPELRGTRLLRRGVVVATVGLRTPRLNGVDWLRVDGGQPLITAETLRDRHGPRPVLYDIPGARNPRYRNLLTTTESLVFAASTGFPWVNLRDLEDPGDLERARSFVEESTRLSCTVSEPRVLQRSIDDLCELGDALLLDLHAIGKKLPPTYFEILTHAVVKRAREHGTPVLVLPASRTMGGHAAAELGRVGQLLAAGAHGLVLTSETEHNAKAQDAVDLARDLVLQSMLADTRGRHSARLVDDDSTGWTTR